MSLAMGMSFSVHPGFGGNQQIGKSTDSTRLIGNSISEGSSILYRSINGTPEQNIRKVIELMGGIEKIIGSDDVVLIKPNVMWWNQGAPNLAALKTLVDLIMERPRGFQGEVILAENCHRGSSPWTSTGSGWVHDFERNCDLTNVSNYNELSRILKDKYKERFSICHLIDVRVGNKRVSGPLDGTGYVYCDGSKGVPLIACENGAKGENRRATIMTYPILRTDKGTVIDFRNGIWLEGAYNGQPFRFINFSALNHHSIYCGMTSSVKNYFGITDLSGGPDPHHGGKLTKEFYNFHSFAFNKYASGPSPGVIGKEIGAFMKTVRKADLNITTAEWIGLASRTELPVAHTRAVMACTDPVALDYHGAKYLLYPNSEIPLHNPDNKEGPLREYLQRCSEQGAGILNESDVTVKSYDFGTSRFQDDADLVATGEKQWGSDPKTLLKYMLLRYAPWSLGSIEWIRKNV